jgi:hydroxymethylpyrimidine/phosphomethylpyrimidine kinase
MAVRPTVLVIAGVDSSGGAGLTRDACVLADFEVDALCAVTAVTAQSNSRVSAVHHVPPEIVGAQIAAAFGTREIGAIKIGMLGVRAIVEAVAEALPRGVPIVLDPVLVATSGGVLLDTDGQRAMREILFPRVTLVTPNVPEAATLLAEPPANSERELIAQAERLLALGPQAVLLKGGHATGEEAVDWLVSGNIPAQRIASRRVDATRRGTGCALASGIAAGLASGMSLAEACERAKRYVAAILATLRPS